MSAPRPKTHTYTPTSRHTFPTKNPLFKFTPKILYTRIYALHIPTISWIVNSETLRPVRKRTRSLAVASCKVQFAALFAHNCVFSDQLYGGFWHWAAAGTRYLTNNGATRASACIYMMLHILVNAMWAVCAMRDVAAVMGMRARETREFIYAREKGAV